MSHDLFDHPATLDDVPYSRRAGKVCGAPVAPSDVPRVQRDHADPEADEIPRAVEPMSTADKLGLIFVLSISAALVLWSVETLVR